MIALQVRKSVMTVVKGSCIYSGASENGMGGVAVHVGIICSIQYVCITDRHSVAAKIVRQDDSNTEIEGEPTTYLKRKTKQRLDGSAS